MSSSNTDFDATLVDWLYGELDAEAAASFEAHLESHPEHKAEAHALRETRVAFRGLPEAEPSNALTAVLMQQAAVAAQPKQGMWAAVVGFFQPVLMHPAAMAMATVVLLAGVAGTLYVRNGKMVAETTVASSEAPPASSATGVEQPAPASVPVLSDLREGEKSEDEAEPEAKPGEALDRGFAADLASPAQEESLQAVKERDADDDDEARAFKGDKKNRSDNLGGLLGAKDGYSLDEDMQSNAISGGAIGTRVTTKRSLTRSRANAPEPVTETAKKSSAPRRSKSAGKPAAKKDAPDKKPVAWETQQVADFQVAARGKRCRDAGRIANDLRDKNPLAYDQNVKGTPEENNCSSYIASESKRRKTARKKALAKSKKKGQGKSVPKKAVAAPAEDALEAYVPAQASGL